jgi:hypothetical protein
MVASGMVCAGAMALSTEVTPEGRSEFWVFIGIYFLFLGIVLAIWCASEDK